MDGSIKVQSEQGEGTTMAVEIPFNSPTHYTTAHLTPKEPTQRDSITGRETTTNVLLVDDNVVNQKLGQTVLRRIGCEVTLAGNGEEAIEAIKCKHYRIIFMDCRMPIMNGYDATIEIRKLERSGSLPGSTQGKNITIIALTANVSSNHRDQCIQSGMDDYISKPCRITDFQAALDAYQEDPQSPPEESLI